MSPRKSLMHVAQGMCEASPLFNNSWGDQEPVSREIFGNMAASGLVRMIEAGGLGWLAIVARDHGIDPGNFAHAVGCMIGAMEREAHMHRGRR